MTRVRSRRGQGELLREEIVAAAARLLAERGSEEAVSIRAIADAVGVTPPSIYLHFADKEELFLAVCDDRFGELDRLSNLAVAGVEDPLERIRLRGEAYIRFGLDNPEHYAVLFSPAHAATASVDQMKNWAAFQHLVDDVTATQEAGDPFLTALALWATVHGITSLMISMPAFPWPAPGDLLAACGRPPAPLPASRGRVRRR